MRFARATIALLATVAALASSAAPVAFVADIRGNATIEGDGRLAFLAELPAGTRLLLGSNAAAAIAYAASGSEFTVVGPGRFLVGDEEVTAEEGAKPKRRTGSALADTAVVARAAQTATASLRMRGLAPVAAPAVLEFPVATRIATLRPEMRWRHRPGEEYVLSLQDAAGRELWRGPGKGSGTRPATPLTAATRYSWTVAGSRGSAGEAHFETLPADVIRRAEKSRSGARTFADRVVHALVLQEVGADQEARAAWAALARERADLPELAALAR